MTEFRESIAVRTLPSGAVLYVVERPDVPIAVIQAVVRTGSIHEEHFLGCGISHFLEHMLFQGCEKFPGNRAAEAIQAVGGESNAYTAFDHTAYYAELPAKAIATGIEVLAAMLTAPEFPEAKFDSEKLVIEREGAGLFDRPESVVSQNLWGEVFHVHPARIPILGYPDKIRAVTRETMCEYYERRYGAGRTHWIIAGAVNPDEVAALLTAATENWRRGNLAEAVLPTEPEQHFPRVSRAHFADPLARICMGVRIPPANAEEIPALDVLSGIIGQNTSSRLVRELWQQKELAISLSSSGYAASFGGIFGVSGSCEPAKLAKLETGIRTILADVRKNGITAAELKREKLQQRLSFYRSLTTARDALAVVNDGVLNYGAPDRIWSYIERLEHITVDTVNAAAARYLDENRFSVALLEPEPKNRRRTVPKAVSAPEPVLAQWQLASGSEYVIMRRGRAPLCDLTAVLPAGAIWETAATNGVGALLAEALSCGPAGYTEEDFYELLDDNAMELSVTAGRNCLTVSLNYPAETDALAKRIFAELLTAPRWGADEFKRSQSNLVEQLASRMLEPRYVAARTLAQMLYGDHPGALSRMGTPEVIPQLRLDDLRAAFAHSLHPGWVKFGANCDGTAAAVNRCEKYFAKLDRQLNWSHATLTAPPNPAPSSEAQRAAFRSVKLPRTQSSVGVAFFGAKAFSKDVAALEVLNHALNGLTSRLFTHIREDNSLAYSTGAALDYGLVPGMIALHAETAPEKAKKALALLHDELSALTDSGLGKAEFEAARLAALAACAKRAERKDWRLAGAVTALFYGADPDREAAMTATLTHLKLAACNRVVKRYVANPERVAVIAGAVE